jgi:hypothetical protein
MWQCVGNSAADGGQVYIRPRQAGESCAVPFQVAYLRGITTGRVQMDL